MTADWNLWAAVTCFAMAAGCLGWTLSRAVRSTRHLGHGAAHASLPPAWRLAAGPAALLAPAVGRALPAARARHLARELEALGFAPALPPAHWEAMRIVHAAAAALAVALLPGRAGTIWLLLAGATAYAAGGLWLRRVREAQVRTIGRELPAWLDLMTVCVEAGATLTSGIRLILEQAPPGPLRSYFERVLREVRSGRPRAQAFAEVAESFAVESLGTLAAALAAAEGAGLGLGQVLRTQAAQRTAERFARAERLAMQAPVKMLGPLILCIFPCTFIVIAVPIAVRLKEALGA